MQSQDNRTKDCIAQGRKLEWAPSFPILPLSGLVWWFSVVRSGDGGEVVGVAGEMGWEIVHLEDGRWYIDGRQVAEIMASRSTKRPSR